MPAKPEYARLKAAGICVSCAAAAPETSYVQCAPCRDRQRADDQSNATRNAMRRAAWMARPGNRERRREQKRRSNAKHMDRCVTETRNRRARLRDAAGSFTQTEWLAIVDRQKGRCARCGQEKPLTRDHVIPLSRGGCNFAFNIQGLCDHCNKSKGSRLDGRHQASLFDRL